MNVLTLMQKFCLRTGIPSPATVLGTTDRQVLQALNILEEEVNDLASRHAWQSLTHEASHTTLALEDQGNINTLDPGFRFIRNNTVWDYTDKLSVVGPVSGQEWQQFKASVGTGPRYQFRFLGDHLLINPIPAAGHSWKFEYESKYAILDTNGTTVKEFFTADTDTLLVPDSVALMGLRWRWAREKGLAYSELFNTYEAQAKDEMGRDGGAKALVLDGTGNDKKPGVFIAPSNWLGH